MINTTVYYAKDTHIVMHMYNLIAYIDIYSKTSGDLRQYYEPDLDNDNNFIDFPPDVIIAFHSNLKKN